MKTYYFVVSVGSVFFKGAIMECASIEVAFNFAVNFLESNEEQFCDNVWFCELRHGEPHGHRYRITKDG